MEEHADIPRCSGGLPSRRAANCWWRLLGSMVLVTASGLGFSRPVAGEVQYRDKLPENQLASTAGVTLSLGEIRSGLSQFTPSVRQTLQYSPRGLERLVVEELLKKTILRETLGMAWRTHPESQIRLRRAEEHELYRAWLHSRIDKPETEENRAARANRFYRKNPSLFLIPARITYRELVLLDAPDMLPAEVNQAETLAALRNALDSHGLRYAMTEKGPIAVAELTAGERTALDGGKPGRIVRSRKEDAGLTFFQIDRMESATLLPVDEITADLRRLLSEVDIRQEEQRFIQSMREKNRLQINNLLMLKSVLGGSGLAAGRDRVVGKLGNIEITVTDMVTLLDVYLEGKADLRDSAWLEGMIEAELLRRHALEIAGAERIPRTPALQERITRARDAQLFALWVDFQRPPARGYPSDSEIKTWYWRNRDQFTVPNRYRLSQIFIPADQGREVADRVFRQAEATDAAGFAELARTHSRHQESAGRGGDIGWIAETRLQLPIRTLVSQSEENSLVGPIQTGAGWQIVRVAGIQNGYTRPLEDVQGVVRNRLRQEDRVTRTQYLLSKELRERTVLLSRAAMAELVGGL